MKKAAILTIGTEITDGQITNTNTKWLAQKILTHNIAIDYHISTADSPPEIQQALKFLSEQVELIFIAGGLGPTSDDITRQVVADFFALPLVLDEPSWKDVQKKLAERKVTVREGHQRQCWLPQTAQAFSNGAGVAPGFYFSAHHKHVWVLPGPPAEIESIWNTHVDPQLREHFSEPQTWAMKTFLCLGIPESELAYQTELFFAKEQFPKKLGYRLPAPYVEVKLWYPPKNLQALQSIEKYKATLTTFYVAETLEHVNQNLQQKLQQEPPFTILDQASNGAFLQRLTKALGSLNTQQTTYMMGENLPTTAATLLLITKQETQWFITWKKNGLESSWSFEAPSQKKSQWREAYYLEKIILGWLQAL